MSEDPNPAATTYQRWVVRIALAVILVVAGLASWHETVDVTDDTRLSTVLQIVTRLGSVSAVAVLLGFSVLSGWTIAKVFDEGRAKGRAQGWAKGRAAVLAWVERRDAAAQAGREFNEAPPKEAE